jgi:hypothetical protein
MFFSHLYWLWESGKLAEYWNECRLTRRAECGLKKLSRRIGTFLFSVL